MTLDEAWAEAEAALPEGWRLQLHYIGPEGPFSPGPGHEFGSPRYAAICDSQFYAGPDRWRGITGEKFAETPVEALQALTVLLRARAASGTGAGESQS